MFLSRFKELPTPLKVMFPLRIIISFLIYYFNPFFVIISISLLDLVDGGWSFLTKNITELKQKWDYFCDGISRWVMIYFFLTIIPEWNLIVIYLLIFYFIVIYLRVTKEQFTLDGNKYYYSILTPPLMFIFMSITFIQVFMIPPVYTTLIIYLFTLVGVIFQVVWHATFYKH